MNCEHTLKVGQKGDTENLKFVHVKSQIDGKELRGPDHPSVHVLNRLDCFWRKIFSMPAGTPLYTV